MFDIKLPKLLTRDNLTDEQFNAMMEESYDQAMSGQGQSVEEAFTKICEDI